MNAMGWKIRRRRRSRDRPDAHNFPVTAVQIQRAREAACGRIVWPADVSRVSGKTRNQLKKEGRCNKMAATMNVVKRTLSVSIARGTDADGNLVTKSYSYSNVKPDAEPRRTG